VLAVKVAVPTDDGIRVSQRFGRVSRFVIAEVALGQVVSTEDRNNPVGTRLRGDRPARPARPSHRDRHRAVGDLLADCRAVIASNLADSMRRTLSRRGLEVVLTSEEFLDRALALFALAALRDESRVDPEDDDLVEPYPSEQTELREDEFDG
jgi:predicted Fe-Mo cluster-binding NifX family protein